MSTSPASGAAERSFSNPSLILWCIAALCGIPSVILGKTKYIEYDGYWHIFIALQDTWERFWHDVYANAHPPLFFVLLKGMLHFGHSFLIYRSVSIVTGILSVYLVGMIVRKITASDIRAYQSALAFGLALPAIIIANEVRSYMLATFFILWSFYYFLDIIESREDTMSDAKARSYFATLASFACLSHYYAFFYCGATLLALLARYIFRLVKNGTAEWVRGAIAETATGLPLVALIIALYNVHANNLAEIQNHLLPYYLDPSGKESLSKFLFRNWQNFMNLFSPFPMSGNVAVALLIAGLVAGVVVITNRSNNDRADRAATFWTLLVTALVIIQLAGFGIYGKYPFGGDLRQQFLAFPFLIFTCAIFVENMAARVGGALRLPIRRLAEAFIIIAVAAVGLMLFQRYPKPNSKLLTNRVDGFHQVVPTPQGVYLDQINLIAFFISYDDWKWTSLPTSTAPGIDTYKLSRDGQEMLVFRDTQEWNIDPERPDVYEKLAACLRATGIGDVAIFGILQAPKVSLSDPEAATQSVRSISSKAGICPIHLLVTPLELYGDFQAPACSTASAH